MLQIVIKCPTSQCQGKWKSDPGSTSGIGSTPLPEGQPLPMSTKKFGRHTSMHSGVILYTDEQMHSDHST